MNIALNSIFESLNKRLLSNLQSEEAIEELSASILPSGVKEFDFHIDGNGNCHTEAEENGRGITIHCVVWFESPDATFTVDVVSTDGGGGHWENVKPNQRLEFKIETSFWHKTKVTVDAHTNVVNQDGKGRIEYSF